MKDAAARIPARANGGAGVGTDGEPGLQATAAHSLPEGVGTVGSMPAEWEAAGGSDSMEPGTRQATVTAARATSSQCHLSATASRLLTRRSQTSAGWMSCWKMVLLTQSHCHRDTASC